MKIFLMVLILVVVLVAIMIYFTRKKMASLTTVKTNENILTLNEANFNHQIKGKLVLIDFWAEWCGPCKIMLPTLNEIAASDDINFNVAKVDVDKNKALAQKYSIRSIPTLIAFRDGKEMNRFIGVKTKNFLINEMKKL
ncbi:MAG: thioredoxin [Paludibacteraceae bacterium]